MYKRKDGYIIISLRLANFLLARNHEMMKIVKGNKEGKDLAFLFKKTDILQQDIDRYVEVRKKEKIRNSKLN